MDNLLTELKTQYELFLRIPFPLDSSDEELSIIHAELVSFDTHIAGLLDTILSNGIIEERLLIYDQNLENRIRSILLMKEGRELIQGNQYLHYLLVLRKLIELANKAL